MTNTQPRGAVGEFSLRRHGGEQSHEIDNGATVRVGR
jgi:hypothetical protein